MAAGEARSSDLERELSYLAGLVVERDREIRDIRDDLKSANERHDRGLLALEALSGRLDEMHAQARGQATRIRMKALHEAVEVSRRLQVLSATGSTADADQLEGSVGAAASTTPIDMDAAVEAQTIPLTTEPGQAIEDAPGDVPMQSVYDGRVEVEIGPLADFSQLVGFEDAAGQIGGASEITVSRFSEGRATLSMSLGEPVDLLRKLESLSPLSFRVRRAADDRLVLDLDDQTDGAEEAA